MPNLSAKLGCFSRRVWHTANATNTPGEVIVFGGSSNFFKNSFEDVETNKVAIFKFVPPKLETLCIDNVFDILKDGGADKWMPSIIRLTRVLRYDFSSRLPVQEQYPEMSKKGETTTTKCSLIPKILHIWRYRGGTAQ